MTAQSGLRYRDIASQLYAAIREGRYPVGSRLPTEQAISAQYGVSRHTARHAVQQLERLGLISRNRGGGTVVVKSDPQPEFTSSIASIEDILQYASETFLEVRRIRSAVALPIVPGAPALEHTQDWSHVEAVRFLKDSRRPQCWTDIFLHPEVAAILPLVGKSPEPIYTLIEAEVGLLIKSVTQTISAALVPEDIASEIAVRPGSAALKVTRAYYDLSDRLIEISVNICAPERFTYRMTILRGGAGLPG